LLPRLKLHDIFGLIEQYRDVLAIKEYSVGQTSLEQVFLDFAKLQSEHVGGRSPRSGRSPKVAADGSIPQHAFGAAGGGGGVGLAAAPAVTSPPVVGPTPHNVEMVDIRAQQ